MLPQDQTTAWMRLPSQLQHQFFKDAEREAEKVKRSLAEKLTKLNDLKKSIRTEKIANDDEWKKLRIAAVDGSNSPTTSERLGIRYGAYSAGYMIFEGSKIVDEGYRSGSFSQEQISDRDLAQNTMSMLRINLERDVAQHCLEQDVDYVLIDGSFFGFRAEAIGINGREIGEGYEDGKQLTEQVARKSWNLLKSGKVVGVIKRTRTSVIDGWLTRTNGNTASCLNMNDKYVMTYLLSPGHYFALEWLLNEKIHHHYYTRFRSIYRQIIEREKKSASMDDVWEAVKRNFEHSSKRILGISGELVKKSARYFVKCSASPPFEFEIFEDANIAPILPYFLALHNPATGLPWPIDLVDEGVTMPQGFTKEFVDEVQARLLRDPEMKDKLKLMEFFSYLNPQKEEE